jgi:hypothetical protein
MESCVLRPPNNQQFSDAVIGGVVQRSRSSRDRFIAGDRSHSLGVGTWAGRSSPQSWPSPQPRERAPSLSTPSSERRWESHQDATKPIVTAKASAEDSIKSEHVQGVNDLVGSEKQRLRELRRQRQIRYRKKKEGYTNSLEEETARLRDEIGKLKQRRRAACEPVAATESVWSVAAEYFRLFRYGVSGQTLSLLSSDSAEELKPSAHLEFVRSRMALDVVLDVGRGPETVIKEWGCISQWFKDVELELEGLEKGPVGTLVASTTTSVTISEKTLRTVFPHLVSGERSPLADKLRGQRIVMRGSVRFEWDAATGRIKGLISQADMLTPLLHVLGGLEDVAAVFDESLVSLDFHWRAPL